ncbi:cytochrome P450 [Vitiosangium sp. GDMCC 1.1324]|uniref:cytochrome P450 n=1 Tax=Vitiosangium sp. (strain GDMCC 1.1324) TaxID=2138576 RepID=UPI000D3C4CFA|nr:cytochrome P450 [Vitiosangium sp. GDMCC 1.1324]PTL85896.1 cytochrome P450 [Vitiosangium sp. GDMCC 1.1324]
MSLLERFDFFSPEVKNNPYPFFAEMREKAPVLWVERFQAYAITRYEDVAYALKNPALFSSEDILLAGRNREERSPLKLGSVSSLVTSDPPLHTRLRGLVSRAFTPKRISDLEPRVRELSRGFVAEMTAREDFDLMDGLATPLPVTIIAEMLGIEPSRYRDFKRWSDMIAASTSNLSGEHSEEALRSAQEMLAYMTEVAEARRREPRGDLISVLVQGGEGASALTPQEVNSFAILLLIAGNETTTNLLGNALNALVRHPEQLEWLSQNPSACAATVEETLRYDSPVVTLLRRTTQEIELSGGKIPAQSSVLVVVASANHDPRKFPDPDRFDIRREPQGVMSFGHGIHFCLGAPLSRLEAPVALQELLARTPRLAFAPRQPERVEYGPSFTLRGPRSLWLRKN